MLKVCSVVFLFGFSLFAYAGQRDFQVLEFEYDTGKVISVGVHTGSQAFFMDPKGDSFVVVPQVERMELYSVNANGAKMGKEAKQVESSDMTLLETALINKGQVNFKSKNISMRSIQVSEQDFALQELQARDQVETAILESGGMSEGSVDAQSRSHFE